MLVRVRAIDPESLATPQTCVAVMVKVRVMAEGRHRSEEDITGVSLDAADATPIFAQVDRGLRATIAAGRLKAGDQLPTVRELAVELKVNANTIARV